MFLYIENVSAMIYGYAFWFIISRITSAEVVGISSSLISISTILVSLGCVGIPLGSQRFLGKLFAEKKYRDAHTVVKVSLLTISGGIAICTSILILSSTWMFFNYEITLVAITVILVASSSISTQLRYIIVASLETKKLIVMSIISSGVKLVLTIILVFEGTDAIGVMIGFTVAPFLSTIFFAFNVRSLLRGRQEYPSYEFIKTFKPLLKASIVSWVPLIIDTTGAQIGTIIVLGIQGSSDAGIYFIAFQITIGISAVIWVLESVTYPALSAMNDRRQVFLWRVIKIGLIIVLPLSSSIIFYADDVIQIFGYDYKEGAYPLQILLLSILPTAVTAGISILAYAYGRYLYVLCIGLAMTIPRTVLYFIFIPSYSGTGAAISFTMGSLIGLAISLIIARRLGVLLYWRDLGLIFVIPLAFGFALSNFNINFVIAILVSVVSSYLLLLKFKIIQRNDVEESMTIFPKKLSAPLTRTITTIASKLNHDY
jgi:O-antigen/teichoic acid export membrane protein